MVRDCLVREEPKHPLDVIRGNQSAIRPIISRIVYDRTTDRTHHLSLGQTSFDFRDCGSELRIIDCIQPSLETPEVGPENDIRTRLLEDSNQSGNVSVNYGLIQGNHSNRG